MDFSRVMSYLRLTSDSDYILACMVRLKPAGDGLERHLRVEKVMANAPSDRRLPIYPWAIEFGNQMTRSMAFPFDSFSDACDRCLNPLESTILAGVIVEWLAEGERALADNPESRWDRNSLLTRLDFDSFVETID